MYFFGQALSLRILPVLDLAGDDGQVRRAAGSYRLTSKATMSSTDRLA